MAELDMTAREQGRWANERRLDFIDWRIATYGTLRRADLAEAFGIDPAIASADISTFLSAYPGALHYDGSAKQYVPGRTPYSPRRQNAWVGAIDWDAALPR